MPKTVRQSSCNLHGSGCINAAASARIYSGNVSTGVLRSVTRLGLPSAVQVDAIDLCRTEVANGQWLPVLCPAQPSAYGQEPDRLEIRACNLLEVSGSYFDPDSLYHRNWARIAVDVFSVAGPLGMPEGRRGEGTPLGCRRIKNVKLPRLQLHREDPLLIR